jgi:hypothetical protein
MLKYHTLVHVNRLVISHSHSSKISLYMFSFIKYNRKEMFTCRLNFCLLVSPWLLCSKDLMQPLAHELRG